MIRINDDYYISADKYNIILIERDIMTQERIDKAIKMKKKINAKDGDISFNEIGYYKTIPDLLDNLFEKRMKKSIMKKDFKDYKELILEMKNLKDEMKGETVELKSILASLLKP